MKSNGNTMIPFFMGFVKTLNKTYLSILYPLVHQAAYRRQPNRVFHVHCKQASSGVNHLFFLRGSQRSVVSAKTNWGY